jgi:SWI/SNF-related matrix-associated actin-dependent regulator of chromatin subfamily A-like protein 1
MTAPDNSPKSLPHQEAGTKFLRDREAAGLFDEQGLGKSKQLIDAVAQDISAGVIDGALIICPNILKVTWADEIEKFCALRYAVFGSGRKARRNTFRSLRAAFYVINYEAVAAEIVSLRALLRFKRIALVLDESHRIKSPEAKVTAAVLSLRKDAAKRYIMSGTPVANRPEDVWSQMFFLDGGELLGDTFEKFTARYLAPGGGYQRVEELRSHLAEIGIRREKEGTVSLPKKSVARVPVRLAPRQREMYEELREELQIWVKTLSGQEVIAQADNILTRLVRLAQIASNPRLIDAGYTETPAKLTVLDEMLDAYLPSAKKVIVWTSFVPNIETTLTRYPRLHPVALHGQMTNEARTAAVKAFKTNPDVRLLVANPAAAREGLTLTESSCAIYLDRTFNLVDFLQSQDRIHRLSQTRDCDIVLLLAEHSIDEFIDFALAQKHRLARYTQSDTDDISAEDLALEKPDILRALVQPSG